MRVADRLARRRIFVLGCTQRLFLHLGHTQCPLCRCIGAHKADERHQEDIEAGDVEEMKEHGTEQPECPGMIRFGWSGMMRRRVRKSASKQGLGVGAAGGDDVSVLSSGKRQARLQGQFQRRGCDQ